MNWKIAPKIPKEVDDQLSEYPPLVRQLVYGRGYTSVPEARRFLEAAPIESAPLRDIGIARDAIRQAIDAGQPIMIYGDYDVDGVTSCALLVSVIKELGGDARCFIPNRFEDGYGLNVSAVQYFKTLHVGLVITVDCGIRSREAARCAREAGIRLIITDHHIPGPVMPSAFAIIDPKQAGDLSDNKELAGVGVAYKLACALVEKPAIPSVLDLVALGTIADVAPLVGENRYLARAGLNQMANNPRLGILELAKTAGIDLSTITANQIGFSIAPRLNAAGRLDTAFTSYDLLMTADKKKAVKLAKELDATNKERQKVTQTVLEMAEWQVFNNDTNSVLFAANPDFNLGVVGLAASRLSEKYYRPALVGRTLDQTTRASCRSIPEVHITDALQSCAHLLESFGGHAAAAGFTIRNENIPDFLHCIREAVGDLSGLQPTMEIDVEINPDELSLHLPELLEWMEPTGQDNRRPTFLTHGMQVVAVETVGKKNNHLKMELSNGVNDYNAIAYNQGHLLDTVLDSESLDVVYSCETNKFRDQTYVQLVVKDLRPSEGG